MKVARPVAEPITDENDVTEMTLRLRSGRFDSSISLPLRSTKEEKQRFIDSWMTLMVAGLRCGGQP